MNTPDTSVTIPSQNALDILNRIPAQQLILAAKIMPDILEAGIKSLAGENTALSAEIKPQTEVRPLPHQ